jgi:hypothetical protein
MIDDFPERTMACEPFLQRLGLSRVRPRQNSTIDIGALQSQSTPILYPNQNVGLMPSSQTLEPQHGLYTLWPWSEEEIEQNSNNIYPE